MLKKLLFLILFLSLAVKCFADISLSGDVQFSAGESSAGGAPTDADYLVGTANGSLSAEIVVGATPGGELGGTWASPTVDDSLAVTSWTLTTPIFSGIVNTDNNWLSGDGGAEGLGIDDSGNVGVGNTAPLALLQVGTSPSPPLFVQAGGNVGIGTTAPSAQLELSGATMKAISNTINFSDVTDGWVLTFDTGTNTWAGEAAGGGSQTPWTANIEGAGYTLTNTGNVGIGTSTPLGLLMVGTSPSPQLVVMTTGNVGIGTTAPANKLWVENLLEIDSVININIGSGISSSLTTGDHNIALGEALASNISGDYNVAIGDAALYYNTTGSRNVAVGSSLINNTTGVDNVAVGDQALADNETGSSNIGLGANAGRQAVGSNELFINHYPRTNHSGDQTKSIIYGLMASDEREQKLLFNAGYVGVGVYTTNVLGALQVGESPTPHLLVKTDGWIGIGTTNPGGRVEIICAGTQPANNLYLKGSSGARLIISQPDGGCSSCGVDSAGTTWSCVDVTCPSGP